MSKDFRVFVKKNSLVDDEPFVDDEPEVGSDVISDSSEDERGNDYDFEDGFLIADEDTENKTATDNDVIEFEKRRAKAAIDEVYALKKKILTLKRKLAEMRSKKRKWRKRANKVKAYAERLERQATEALNERVEGLSHEED